MYLPTVRCQDYNLRLLASKAFMKQSRCRTKICFYIVSTYITSVLTPSAEHPDLYYKSTACKLINVKPLS